MIKTKLQMLIDGKLYLWLALVAFPSLILAGCGEDNNPENLRCRVRAVAGPEDDVVGKWKLVRQTTGFARETKDYSCDNIVYHFRVDGKLGITNNFSDEVPYQTGEYDFELIFSPHYEHVDGYTLTINRSGWICHVEPTSLILDNSPTDGPKMEFIRID